MTGTKPATGIVATNSDRPRPGDDIETEIGALAELDLSSLRRRWFAFTGSEPPVRMSRELIIRAVAYWLQEEIHGGLRRAVRAKLIGTGLPSGGRSRGRVRTDRSIKPGTKFLREWDGRTHEVVALADGRYLYQGIAYRSLSAVARTITGTRWSGPTFFGLNPRRRGGDARA